MWGVNVIKLDETWNGSIVKNLAHEDDALVILETPCGGPYIDDTLIWHYTKDGEYNVKTGYKVDYNNNKHTGTSIESKNYAILMKVYFDFFHAT